MADQQEICLKMHEMPILETLNFKNLWGSIPSHPPRNLLIPPVALGQIPAFGILKLGVYGLTWFLDSEVEFSAAWLTFKEFSLSLDGELEALDN